MAPLAAAILAAALAPGPVTPAVPAASSPSGAPPSLAFREVSEEWGLDFRHRHGGSGERYMVETMVGGVALFDYDGDGDLDVFFVDGGVLPGYEGPPPRSRLFRNDGGRFRDVTERSGVEVAAYGCGAIAGDVDGDGDLDLYVSAFGKNQLFLNEGGGTFADSTDAAGVGDELWSMGAAFGDPDRDGDLDLYVANYVDFSTDDTRFCGDRERGIRVYCDPRSYDGLPDSFFRNRGDGTFERATEAAGLAGPPQPGLGVVFGDLNRDGWPDLYVANDTQPNQLFRNRGHAGKGRLSFEDVSLLSGSSYSDRGTAEAGMGVGLGDVDGDADLDIVVTNFEMETNALYRNTGPAIFVDARHAARLAEPSLRDLGFGALLSDLDLDGDLDLVVANGHIYDNAALLGPDRRYAQENRIHLNAGDGRFRELTGAGLSEVRASRGLASGDLDGDGDLDLVFSNVDDRAEVYENLVEPDGRWLALDLRLGDGGNVFGVGAQVSVEAGGEELYREVRTGGSYLSHGPPTLRFGLDGAGGPRLLRVRWPDDGGVREVRGLPSGRRLMLFR